jgi:hypothetical protein
MTDKEWADKRCAEREIKRLAAHVAALERRLQSGGERRCSADGYSPASVSAIAALASRSRRRPGAAPARR